MYGIHNESLLCKDTFILPKDNHSQDKECLRKYFNNPAQFENNPLFGVDPYACLSWVIIKSVLIHNSETSQSLQKNPLIFSNWSKALDIKPPGQKLIVGGLLSGWILSGDF